MKLTQRRELSELPDSVSQALEALQPVPEADPVAWERHRQTYLTMVRAEAAASTDGRQPLVPETRRGWRAALGSLLSFRVRDVHPMTHVLRLALVMALLLGTGAGTVAAARESLPGTMLYPLKVRLEQWDLERVDDALRVSERALSQTQTRFWEINQLTEKGKPVPDDVAARYEEHLSLALQASGMLTEPLRLQTQSQISETLQHQMETMSQIAAKVQGDGEDDGAVQAVIRTMEMTQAQLGTGMGQEETEVQGEPHQAGPAEGPHVDGPGESDEDANRAAGPNEESGYGPGDQAENDEGSGSVNGPDRDRGHIGGDNGTNGGDNGGANGGGGGNR